MSNATCNPWSFKYLLVIIVLKDRLAALVVIGQSHINVGIAAVGLLAILALHPIVMSMT